MVIWGADMTGALPTIRGGWSWAVASVADVHPDAPLQELQIRMRQEEGRLAEDLCAAGCLTVVDGPLNFIRSRDLPVVGFVKTHHRALLDPEHHRQIPGLGPGQRSSLFRLGRDRYSAYLRLAPVSAISSPWSGIVRTKVPQSAGLAAAIFTADRIAGIIPRYAADAGWAHELKTATEAALARARKAITGLQRQQDDAVAAISRALAAARADDEPGLQQAIIDVSADLRRAADDIRTATEQILRAVELVRRIEKAQGLLEALDELARLLSDGKFIAYVVARKQQTLLAIATELLGSMTGSRYGFSEEFEIVYRLTGLPRSAKTLSGGETFLASLALALGLGELAGRGGGRLDALFLDEGFGALDANALSEAFDALGRQTETGRLVAVISHLRSVAEAMDRVLAVAFGKSGSQTRWLGGDERAELITEDVEASLLT